MKDHSEAFRSESPSTSRRSVLAGLAALGVVYAVPGLFQVNEAMAEPGRKPQHSPGHSKKSRRSRRSHHSKAGKHHGRRSHSSKHGQRRRSHASRMMLHPDSRRPI